MAWIAIVIVIIAAFALPRFGHLLVRIIGGVVVLAALGAVVLLVMNQRQEAERERAKNRIKPGEIELSDLVLKNGYGLGSYTLAGRVRNRSNQYALHELTLRLTMRDCSPSSECEIVGQTDETIHADVPPGQARDVNDFVHFSGLGSPHGKHQWDYEVREIFGR